MQTIQVVTVVEKIFKWANKSSGHPQLSIKLKTYKRKTQKIHWKLVEFNVNRFTVHKEQYKANRGLYPGIKNLMQNHKT